MLLIDPMLMSGKTPYSRYRLRVADANVPPEVIEQPLNFTVVATWSSAPSYQVLELKPTPTEDRYELQEPSAIAGVAARRMDAPTVRLNAILVTVFIFPLCVVEQNAQSEPNLYI